MGGALTIDTLDGSILERIARFREDTLATGGTWPAKRRLAAGIRELLDCVCITDASQEELLAAAREIQATVQRFASQQRTLHPAGFAELAFGGMETFHDRSPVVGLSNPIAPPLDLMPDAASGIVRGTGRFGSAYEGAPGCVHGGFLAAAFDELLGMACIFSGNPGMTGEITVRYRRPTPIATELRFEGRLDRVEGRRIFTSGETYLGDTITAESTGIFISITREKFEELGKAKATRAPAVPTPGASDRG